MKKWISSILLILILIFGIIGCGDDVDDDEIKAQEISGSYTIEELAAMDPDERKELCENKHIEVSGIAEKAGMSFEIGSKKKDGIYVSCAFVNYDDKVSAIEEGDYVILHGACTSSYDDSMFIFKCELSEVVEETTKEIPVDEEKVITEESDLVNLPIIVEETKVEEKEEVAEVEKSESVVEKKEETKTEPEPAPAPEPQPESNGNRGSSEPSVTVPDHEEAGPNLVWVPTKGGKKYHTGPGCSNMEDPMQVTVETATANGYTPCKRCH